jgi:hypothetical protein
VTASPPPGAAPSFAALAAEAARALGRGVDELAPEVRLGAVCRDSLDLYCLHVVADGYLPGFELPHQLDVGVATLGDLHHYLVVAIAHRAGDRATDVAGVDRAASPAPAPSGQARPPGAPLAW